MISSEKLFNYLADIIILCDKDYTIVESNHSANMVYGMGESVTGGKCYEIIRGESSPCEDCPLNETLESGKLIPIDNYDERFGEYMEERTHPVLDDKGELEGFVLVGRNVSKDREIKDRSVQDKKLTAIGRISSGVAHDFNNLLQVVLGRVNILKKSVTDEKILEQLDIITQAAENGADTVRRMQDFTRADNESKLMPLNISELIGEVVNLTSHKWKEYSEMKGIIIQIVPEISPDLFIRGNLTELRNAATNIIFNAVDAMPDGGVLIIKVFQEGKHVVVSFKDTGIGMTEETRERIFDPFYTTKGVKGTGLGMSEVYGIIQRHKGDIEVDSEQGKGTTICMKFPATDERITADEPISEAEDKSLQILIIDDDKFVLEVIRELLSDLGHAVTAFSSATEALDHFSADLFDLVITDLGMPEMSGKEVAENIKSRAPDMPVILLSGWAINVRENPELSKVVDYSITKPFDIDKIQNIVVEAARKGKE